jgi:pimeloyl-ACP methyl ester carboxylesterase
MTKKRLEKTLNVIGGIPDIIIRNFPDPTRKRSQVGHDEYLSRLNFYSSVNWAEKSFLYIPESVPHSEEEFVRTIKDGSVKVIKYPSRYLTRNPVMAGEFEKYMENQSGYLYIWRHDHDEDRPLVLCLHGFLMGTPRQATSMFKFGKLFSMGLDVALYVQPHHWKRTPDPRVQRLLNQEDAPLTIETVGQNIHDLHSAVLLLKSKGYNKIGIIGASLGGFTAGLYATFNAPVDFMFMVVPAANFDHYLDPRKAKFSFKVDSKILSKTRDALKIIAPPNYKPAFNVEKISMVIHAGDRLAEANASREWIRKWNIANYVEVTGGHWLYFDRSSRAKAWYGWLKKMGYIS